MLVFAQHVAFLDGEEELWIRLHDLKKQAREKKIAVEVTDRAAAVRAAVAGVDIVQVDKMAPEELRNLVQAVRDFSCYDRRCSRRDQREQRACVRSNRRGPSGDLSNVLGKARRYRRPDGIDGLSDLRAATTRPGDILVTVA